MRENNSDLRERGQNVTLVIFESVMAVVYLLVAGVLLLTDYFKDSMISNGIRIGLGIIFAVYGVFRVFRAVRKIRNK